MGGAGQGIRGAAGHGGHGDVRETDFLRQRLSIAIQRGNALAIRGNLGLHKDCEERDD